MKTAVAVLTIACLIAGCEANTVLSPAQSIDETTELKPVVVPEPETPETVSDAVESDAEAASFLIQATYGPTLDSIAELRQSGYSAWFRNQVSTSADLFLDDTIDREAEEASKGIGSNLGFEMHTLDLFFEKAQTNPDQLRQRAHFALSQIFATATDVVHRKSYLHASFKDVMVQNAFGSFRDLLQDVTYHPMMGSWLTYAGNRKADPATGSAPDENYAREIMQLFTIGLDELNLDGSSKRINGQRVDAYTLNDVVELAKVFTGLYFDGLGFGGYKSLHNRLVYDTHPMVMHNEYHSTGVKTFLGETVPDYGDGDQTISHALDILFEHDNVAPFITKQLIQRMTTSNPSPAYVERVATVFNSGEFTLPDGSVVGSGERGDLTPVWAAILFDPDARSESRFDDETWGKVREPIIKQVHWMRAADASGYRMPLWNIVSVGDLGQVPYKSPSVFNFYRPGFRAPNTDSNDAGMVAPELQIINGPVIVDTLNRFRNLAYATRTDGQFVPSYSHDMAVAESAEELVDYLNLIYTANTLDVTTRQLVIDAIESIDLPDDAADRQDALWERVKRAHLLVITSIEFMIQR